MISKIITQKTNIVITLEISFFFKLINLFLRESMSRGRAEREGDTESEAGSRLWVVSTEPDAGLELTNREIMTWAEVRHPTDWATQAPQERDFLVRASVINAKHSAWCIGDRCISLKETEGKGQALNPDLLNSQIYFLLPPNLYNLLKTTVIWPVVLNPFFTI